MAPTKVFKYLLAPYIFATFGIFPQLSPVYSFLTSSTNRLLTGLPNKEDTYNYPMSRLLAYVSK